ncbi:hypothetical protein JX266_013722 [Neoarthrinium moseri]|nr:hypothetical protein JX266_013722 [Neoarthrinium moseri]
MTAGQSLGDLLPWARGQGVVTDGIEAAQLPGRGAGIVAKRHLRAGEAILKVPFGAVRCLDTVPNGIRDALPEKWTIHSLLALDLALNHIAKPTPWNAILPSLESLEECVPLLWPSDLQALLPGPALSLLGQQQARLRTQWDLIPEKFTALQHEDYLRMWFLINSRTFYNSTPTTETYPWEDRLALLPVADLFNHADTGCEVTFNSKRYKVTTDRAYRAGEELYISYGDHSNDFLLVEYGFILAENQWDEVCIDDAILPHLSNEHKAELGEKGLLGNYVLRSREGACRRTESAVRLRCYTAEQWVAFAEDGVEVPDAQDDVNKLLSELLQSYIATIQTVIGKLERMKIGKSAQRRLLIQRWEQIRLTIGRTVDRLQTTKT